MLDSERRDYFYNLNWKIFRACGALLQTETKRVIRTTETNTCEASTDFSVPELGKGQKYHVFISYSSGDSIWVFGLVHKLESSIPGLKICFHERDFVPGKTIIDNMIECIQSSQKTVMVLSPDFLRSRWCLFETNLSIFQDCMLHKSIVPIMLKPCPVPLHLSTLTYLEADDEQFFEKLTQVILNKNYQLPHSSLIHYQSSLLYSGKTLHTMVAVNEEREAWQPGVFSSSPVPDSLRAVVDDPTLYKEAIEIINDIKPSDYYIPHPVIITLLCFITALLLSGCIVYACDLFLDLHGFSSKVFVFFPILVTAVLPMPLLYYKISNWPKQNAKLICKIMIKKTCQANLLLSESSLFAGCSKSQLFFVYVNLRDCKKTFQATFSDDSILALAMWKKAISMYSSDYACCLSKKSFSFGFPDTPGHLKDGVCFCQYVAAQLETEKELKDMFLEIVQIIGDMRVPKVQEE
ncbi:uncharacterized protein PAF06_001090 [Gastrophryne carolinensis]